MWTDGRAAGDGARRLQAGRPAEVRELYRRHARGNSLFRNRGDGTLRGRDARGARGVRPLGVVLRRLRLRQRRLGGPLRGERHVHAQRRRARSDLDSFFWRQVVARSPLTRVTGTPYDDAWRATNRLLISDRSPGQHERNVLLRNDGHGGFDDVSGTRRPRPRPGRPLVRRARPRRRRRPGPRADGGALRRPSSACSGTTSRGAAPRSRFAWSGTKSNRDAVGARVTVETDRLRRTKVVHAGSGFLSQHSKELLFGLGDSQRVLKLTIDWPSGRREVVEDDVPLKHRLHVVEGGDASQRAVRDGCRRDSGRRRPRRAPRRPRAPSWLYEPFPAPGLHARGSRRHDRDPRRRCAESPAVVLFWASGVAASRAALEALTAAGDALTQAGVLTLAVALDAPEDLPKVRAAAARACGCRWSLRKTWSARATRSSTATVHEPPGPARADRVPARRHRRGREGLPRPRGRRR